MGVTAFKSEDERTYFCQACNRFARPSEWLVGVVVPQPWCFHIHDVKVLVTVEAAGDGHHLCVGCNDWVRAGERLYMHPDFPSRSFHAVEFEPALESAKLGLEEDLADTQDSLIEMMRDLNSPGAPT